MPATNVNPTAAGANTIEVYGFAGWLASVIGLGVWLIWALVPDNLLHAAGIYYYPDKYWSIALPCWLVGTVIAVLILIECLNLSDAQTRTDKSTVRDGSTRWVGPPSITTGLTSHYKAVPPLMHLPATFTSDVLYSGRSLEDAVAKREASQKT